VPMEEGVTEAATGAVKDRTDRTDRMPMWVPKGIALFWLGFILVEVVEGIISALRALLVTLLVSLFLSFAIEPAVNYLARRGWRRGGATAAVFGTILAVITVFVFAIGSLVVTQVRNFVDDAPEYVQDLEEWVNDTFDAEVDFDDLGDEFDDPEGPARQFVENIAGDALTAGLEKTGGYLYSRLILAGLSTGFHWIALTVLDVPYALALALWVGVVSQFIPVVGTYLAGALAVVVAALNDPVDGLIVLGFVIVYQQVENYIFAPRVTAETMSLHPAVAFASVIAGAALLGPVGALLALPAAAVIQAFISTLGDRHEVVESDLTTHPERRERQRRRDR